jgi:hypothetical protein
MRQPYTTAAAPGEHLHPALVPFWGVSDRGSWDTWTRAQKVRAWVGMVALLPAAAFVATVVVAGLEATIPFHEALAPWVWVVTFGGVIAAAAVAWEKMP